MRKYYNILFPIFLISMRVIKTSFNYFPACSYLNKNCRKYDPLKNIFNNIMINGSFNIICLKKDKSCP